MAHQEKKEKTQWVSDCCLAETVTSRPYGGMMGDSPPDPITSCMKCGRKCEEWGLTTSELIEEKRKRRGTHHGS